MNDIRRIYENETQLLFTCACISFKSHFGISRHEIQLVCIGFSTVAESEQRETNEKNKKNECENRDNGEAWFLYLQFRVFATDIINVGEQKEKNYTEIKEKRTKLKCSFFNAKKIK